MLGYLKEDFPELFTKKGKMTRQEPKKYICEAGHEFNRTQSLTIDGITFGRIICPKCNRKGQRKVSYAVWRRATTGQMEVEDFILQMIDKRKNVRQDHVYMELEENFGPNYNQAALGFLVYHGYLKVDQALKGEHNIIRYSINPEKDWKKRYENVW